MHGLQVSTLILTEFSEIGGVRRGLVKLRGRPLLHYVFEAVPDEVDDIVVSVRDEEEARAYGELVEEHFGRLVLSGNRGIASSLYQLMSEEGSERVLVLPCDAPLLTVEFTSMMLDLTRRFGAAVLTDSDGVRNYLFSSFRSNEFVKAYETVGKRDDMDSVMKGIRNAIYVNYRALRSLDPKLTFLLRVTSGEDLRRAERIMASR
ncbi:MAG: NTP transferase domain-containing protein [Nitrososphaerota archaeon]